MAKVVGWNHTESKMPGADVYLHKTHRRVLCAYTHWCICKNKLRLLTPDPEGFYFILMVIKENDVKNLNK